MTDRYAHIQPWEQLQDGAHSAVIKFGIDVAKEKKCPLIVCVHDFRNCDQIISKCFNSMVSKELQRTRKPIKITGVAIRLESVRTLKKNLAPGLAAYVALFPSQEMLHILESTNNVAAIIVFSDSYQSEHLEAWQGKHAVQTLEFQKK